MALGDYPVDLRADKPAQSSRLWAVLTIVLVKFLAMIPHFFVLVFLGIAQWVVAFVAQIVVAIRGEYPAGMFRFVVGVMRWSTRVTAFVLSLSDRYPPFTLEPDPSYPVDIAVERPAKSNRLYALFTVIAQVLFVAGGIALAIVLARHTATSSNLQSPSWSQGFGAGLFLRQLAALPHYVVLFFLGIAAFVIWIVVQWVILFTASYPKGMFDFTAGIVRWEVRVQSYAFGLIDPYPPFGFDPSIGATPTGPALAAPSFAPSAPAVAPAQWYADPSGRHQYRYWDGAAWTASVADEGVESSDSV
jgi:hypothetical protein